jgi:hypothetical protein
LTSPILNLAADEILVTVRSATPFLLLYFAMFYAAVLVQEFRIATSPSRYEIKKMFCVKTLLVRFNEIRVSHFTRDVLETSES